MSTTDDVTAVFSAIAAGDASGVGQLLDADPALATATAEGVSVLRATAYAGHPELGAALLARGLVPDGFDAAALGDVDRLRDLIEADPNLVSAHSPDGFAALHLAAWFGHDKVVELLLNKGADPEAVTANGLGIAPLNSAAAGGHTVIAHLLLDRGADVDVAQQGGITSLHAAAVRDDVSMVALLLGRGADPALVTDDGRTAADLTTDPSIRALLP